MAEEVAAEENEDYEPTSDCGGYDLSSPSGYVSVHLCGRIEDAERWALVRADIQDLIEILKPVADGAEPA